MMSRRLLWTAVSFLLLVWSANALRHAIDIFKSPNVSRQIFHVSTIACVLAVALLAPLALRWESTSSRWVRSLISSIRIAAWVGLVLDAASVWLHLRLDHGPGGDYPGWDLGPVAFGWHHQYFLHNAIAAVLVLWLVAQRAVWESTSQQEPAGRDGELRPRSKRLGKVVEVGALVMLLGFLMVGLVLEWSGDAGWPSAPWRIVVAEAESVTEGDATVKPCSLRDGSLLVSGVWAAWSNGDGTAASCRYLVHRRGAPGEAKCLLEFPVATTSGLTTETLAAKLARSYYRDIRGLDEIRLYASENSGSSFLILDARWCQWDAFVRGIQAVP